jgi:hypothetical protein
MASDYGFRTTADEQEVFQRLRDYHGIAIHVASERLHRLKARHGLRGNDDVIFDLTGNVYIARQSSPGLEWVGTLTARD